MNASDILIGEGERLADPAEIAEMTPATRPRR
jgi:hypothetical protein